MVSSLFSSVKDFPQTVMALNSSQISSRVFPLVSGRRKKVYRQPSRETKANSKKQYEFRAFWGQSIRRVKMCEVSVSFMCKIFMK